MASIKNVGLALAEPAADVAPSPGEEEANARVVSVIISVLTDTDGVITGFQRYHAALASQDYQLEFVYVLGRSAHRARGGLETLKAAGAPFTLVVLSRWDGEVAALKSGFRHARGAICILLPVEPQVEDDELPKLLHTIAAGADMALGARVLDTPPWGQRLQNQVFHALIRSLFGRAFNDLACRARVCRRQVLDEILGHASQHQFLGLLAAERGFDVREVPLKAQHTATNLGGLAPLRLGARLRLALDVMALYAVLNYVRKPFRFFGGIGLLILIVGGLFASFLAFDRLWFGSPLADRPALILAVLLIVVGIQVIVLGLIGEIIIFASGRRLKDYTIDRIL